MLQPYVEAHLQEAPVLQQAVYLAGYSNGGFLASLLAMEGQLPVRGIATMAGWPSIRTEHLLV